MMRCDKTSHRSGRRGCRPRATPSARRCDRTAPRRDAAARLSRHRRDRRACARAQHAVIAARRQPQPSAASRSSASPPRPAAPRPPARAGDRRHCCGHAAARSRHSAPPALRGRRRHARRLRRALGRRRQDQIGGGDRRHFDMQVDAVEQRAGNARLILRGAARIGLRGCRQSPDRRAWPQRHGFIAATSMKRAG